MTRFTPQWLQAGNYAASVDRRLIAALWPTGAVTGCAVTVSSGMTVNIAAGSVAVPTANNTGAVLCTSDANEQVTLAAAPASGTNRIDLVICQARGADIGVAGGEDFIFATTTGTAAATPNPPAVPAGAVALAQIYVTGGSVSVTSGNITDRRGGILAVASARAAGTTNVTFSNSTASAIVTVTLPTGRFAAAPIMTAAMQTSGYWWPVFNGVTNTNFQIRAVATTNLTSTTTIMWMALAAT